MIKIFFIFLIANSCYSQENDDILLINIVLEDINSINNKRESILLKKHDNKKIRDILLKKRVIYLDNRLLKKADTHFFEKIRNNCIHSLSTDSICRDFIFSKKELKRFYTKIFNQDEINNYEKQIHNIKKSDLFISRGKIKSKNIIFDETRKFKSRITKPLYTRDNKFAFLILKKGSKKTLYIFKKKKKCWRIKWKKENLTLKIAI